MSVLFVLFVCGCNVICLLMGEVLWWLEYGEIVDVCFCGVIFVVFVDGYIFLVMEELKCDLLDFLLIVLSGVGELVVEIVVFLLIVVDWIVWEYVECIGVIFLVWLILDFSEMFGD